MIKSGWILFCTLLFAPALSAGTETVVLLHGLARGHGSMEKMGEALAREGFFVVNVDYPSSSFSIQELGDRVIQAIRADEDIAGSEKIHFVTHSMGGILVRSFLARNDLPQLGRVVMLAPPNQGSELVDAMGDWWIFEAINGAPGQELGTGPTSTPHRLGPVDFELGVIAGDRSINWINSMIIDGTDDGKVSVERTEIDGMSDHVVIHATHPFIMKNAEAIEKTIQFLKTGAF